MPDKSEIYRVDGMNAELHYYLKHLVRKTRQATPWVLITLATVDSEILISW